MTEKDWYKDYEQFMKQFAYSAVYPDNLEFFKAVCKWQQKKDAELVEDFISHHTFYMRDWHRNQYE